jgi:hypothetical protein
MRKINIREKDKISVLMRCLRGVRGCGRVVSGRCEQGGLRRVAVGRELVARVGEVGWLGRQQDILPVSRTPREGCLACEGLSRKGQSCWSAGPWWGSSCGRR